MIAGYVFNLRCPNCGDELHHENSGRPTDDGRRVMAIAKCDRPGCRLRWTVTVHMERMGTSPPSRDGGVRHGSLVLEGKR